MNSECEAYSQRVSPVLEMLRGKWTLQILCAMRSEPVRMGKLTRLIPAASKKALRAGLRDLELAQIVVRRDLSLNILHVEYDFADAMRNTACDLLDHLDRWAELIDSEKKLPPVR